jgi:hypothetical protein
MPARNINRWLAMTASAGTSLRVGIKALEYFMVAVIIPIMGGFIQ